MAGENAREKLADGSGYLLIGHLLIGHVLGQEDKGFYCLMNELAQVWWYYE